jgi:hypothetical protein
MAAAVRVSDAIHYHAEVCADEPDNVSAAIQAGEALCRAVLHYETVLHATSGWSMPVRHLGPLPLFGAERQVPARNEHQETPSPETEAASRTKIDVCARYRLDMDDEDELLAFVSGRFAEEVSDLGNAVRMLYEAESWDPDRYPPGLLNVEDVLVEISVDRAR